MFDLMLIPALVSTSVVFVLTRLLWIIHHQATIFRQRALRLVGILLLAVLASCYLAPGAPLPRSRVPSRKVALLSFSPDASSLPALQSSEQSTDWPTYHHDNVRTGYLAHEPDPKRLVHAWTAQLDHAVYAEPLVIGERGDARQRNGPKSAGEIPHLRRRKVVVQLFIPFPPSQQSAEVKDVVTWCDPFRFTHTATNLLSAANGSEQR